MIDFAAREHEGDYTLSTMISGVLRRECKCWPFTLIIGFIETKMTTEKEQTEKGGGLRVLRAVYGCEVGIRVEGNVFNNGAGSS